MAMASDSKEPIFIFLMHGIPLVFDEEECNLIKQNRIMGTYIGPLPKFAKDKDKFGLPLRLMKEEARLLIDKGIAKMVEFSTEEEDLKAMKLNFKSEYETRENDVNKEQNRLEYEKRINAIKKYCVNPKEEKRKKLKLNISSKTQTHMEEECEESKETCNSNQENIVNEKIREISVQDQQFVEICMEHPFLSKISLKSPNWTYPETEKEKLLYKIFKDLWENNYTMTSGIKFGGDYLACQGDPSEYHAKFIIRCIEHDWKINPRDITLWTRVGTHTHKILVIASVRDDTVNYQYFRYRKNAMKL